MNISEKIFEGCKCNLKQEQENLYKIVYVDLIRVALRYVSNNTDAEDVINRAMFKVFTKLEEFNGTHLNLGGWIKRIVVNEAIDMIRSKKSFDGKHVTMDVLPDNTINEDAINEDPSHILVLLEALPEKSKTVFNLYVIEGYKHNEIGALLGISVANSKWNLYLARKKLRAWIIEKELV